MLREARQGSAAASRAGAQAAELEAAHKRREAERRLQPRTPADFALLHSELEAWRLAETARIKSAGLSPEDCHQALAHLLHQVPLACERTFACMHACMHALDTQMCLVCVVASTLLGHH